MEKKKRATGRRGGARLLFVLLTLTAALCAGCTRRQESIVLTAETAQSGDAEKEAEQDSASSASLPSDDAAETASVDVSGEQPSLYVDVSGAVRRPGVYRLPEGARVFEALEAAGGCTPEAAAESLNQAALLRDEDQLRVPTREQWEKAKEAEAAGAPALPGGSMAAAPDNAAQGKAAADSYGLRRQDGGTQGDTAADGYGLLHQDGGAAQGGGNTAGAPESGAGTGAAKVNINTATAQELQTLPGIGASKAAAIVADREKRGPFSSPEDLKRISGIKEGLLSKIRAYITTGT